MNLFKTITSKFLSHSAWSGVGVLVAIAGFIISYLQFQTTEGPGPEDDQVTVSLPQKPDTTNSQLDKETCASYWRAEDFYTQALYAQAARNYTAIIQRFSPPLVVMLDKLEIEQARKEYDLGKFKFSADRFRLALQPLANNGVFGSKILK